jgi:hypothetical protein
MLSGSKKLECQKNRCVINFQIGKLGRKSYLLKSACRENSELKQIVFALKHCLKILCSAAVRKL